MYELTIERTFNAAHSLTLYDGEAEPLHGHDWRVVVHIAADELDRIGVVVDFHELERWVEEAVAPLRHTNLNELEAFAGGNPSAERVAEHLAGQITARLPERVRLLRVAVTEAPGCVATYVPA